MGKRDNKKQIAKNAEKFVLCWECHKTINLNQGSPITLNNKKIGYVCHDCKQFELV